ncbi:MAG: SEL1-like repeat protein [Clostridiales bacterium]|nr:SEL1-like repeat protein [Clostridiales bacterium]
MGKAAADGHQKACYVLALCYKNGTGVEKDEALAATWLRRAFGKNS